MDFRAALTDRIVPILTLLLLSTPLTYIGTIFHEEGHGLLALAQGGTFTGIVIGQGPSYALASSYLVPIGGWIGDYVLLVMVLLLSWILKPRSFLARSVVAMLVLFESIGPPAYIASLQGDSAATLHILEATGIGYGASVAILESVALVLFLAAAYVSWRVFRPYFSQSFPWITRRRASLAAISFVVASEAIILAGNVSPVFGTTMALVSVVQVAIFAAFLVGFSLLAIPAAPPDSTGRPDGGPSTSTVVFVVLLFIEAQLVFFFVLPITIPFP
jgi:hypothetical protein